LRATLKSERGTTLIETVIATSILLVVMAGLLGMVSLATTYTENHGHLEARTTEYAQDKMEQLLAIAYTDHITNTITFPSTAGGGTGLAIGGSVNTAAPVNGYVDWLAPDGSLLGGGAAQPANWYYERVWEVTQAAPGLKQIVVTTTVRSAFARAMIPKSTVVALKASQF
jgi:hypothetical protein